MPRPVPGLTHLIDHATAGSIVDSHRDRLLDRRIRFCDIMHEASMAPALSSLVHFAHWQTPVDLPKRFDTHFFLVAAPQGQQPRIDGREMVDGFWIAPGALVEESKAGQRTLVPATRFNLELLAQSPTVADATAAALARRKVMVLPTRVVTAGGPRMTIPEEAGYATTWFPSRRG